MQSTVKLLGVIFFGIAVTFCLTLCSYPEILTLGKAKTSQCHTEEDQENDSGDYCCSAQAILPVTQNHYFVAVVHDWTFQAVIPARPTSFHRRANLIWFPLIFDSIAVPILRI